MRNLYLLGFSSLVILSACNTPQPGSFATMTQEERFAERIKNLRQRVTDCDKKGYSKLTRDKPCKQVHYICDRQIVETYDSATGSVREKYGVAIATQLPCLEKLSSQN